jgi:hypothetical protein
MPRKLSSKQEAYYVYHLIDPRDGIVFYIGKGKGSRLDQHQKDAVKRAGQNEEKEHKIREILRDGHEIRKTIVDAFLKEQDAYDCEEYQIKQYGLASLTNMKAGGGTARDSFSLYVMRDLIECLWRFDPLPIIKDPTKRMIAEYFWSKGFDRERQEMMAKDKDKFLKELNALIEEKYSGWFIGVSYG